MYSMVLMAALTTGVDMPDRGGRRGGGCCGCYGGMGMGYGGGYGGCMGMGYGGMGWGGGYSGMGGGWGGGYGGMRTVGGYGMGGGWGGWGTGTSQWMQNPYQGYLSGTAMLNTGGLSQSFYFNPVGANEATIIVHLPENASLSIDGQQTQQRSSTRVFTSPPLQPGKTYTYTLRAEMQRDGRTVNESRNVDVRAGQSSVVNINFEGSRNRGNNDNEPAAENQTPARRTLPTPPPDR